MRTWQNRIIGEGEADPREIVDNPQNWRRHPELQGAALEEALGRLGWIQRVVVNRRTGRLIDGHLRVELARRRGEEAVPVLYVDLDEEEERLALATLDPLSALAEPDTEQLLELLSEIDDVPPALTEMLAEIASHDSSSDPDSTAIVGGNPDANVAAELGVELGQHWRIGSKTTDRPHMLIVGDSTLVSRPPSAKTLVWDPPWNNWITPPGGFEHMLVFGDGATIGRMVSDIAANHALEPQWIFVWDCVSSWYTPNRPLRRIKSCAWYGDIESYDQDGWHYGEPNAPRTVKNTRGEYDYVPDDRGKHLSDLYVMPITKLHASGQHQHEKPVEWLAMLLANCTSGDIYDPYGGSGATLMAAETIGRIATIVEIDVDVAALILSRAVDAGLDIELVGGIDAE